MSHFHPPNGKIFSQKTSHPPPLRGVCQTLKYAMVPIYQIFGTAWILPKKKRDHNAMAIHRNNRISYKRLRIRKKNTENLMKYLQSCIFLLFWDDLISLFLFTASLGVERRKKSAKFRPLLIFSLLDPKYLAWLLKNRFDM